MTFSIINLIVIVVIVGLAIIGLFLGFSKKKLMNFATSLGFSVAYLGGIPLARLLMNTDLNYNIIKMFSDNFPTTSTFTDALSSDTATAATQVATALSELKVPTFFAGLVINRVTLTSSTVGDALGSAFTFYILTIAMFIIVFLAVFLLVYLLLRPLWVDGRLFGDDGKTLFGRICGAVSGLAKGISMVLSAMMVVVLIEQLMIKFGNTALFDYLQSDLTLGDASHFNIARIFYNTASSLFSWIGLSSLGIGA